MMSDFKKKKKMTGVFYMYTIFLKDTNNSVLALTKTVKLSVLLFILQPLTVRTF